MIEERKTKNAPPKPYNWEDIVQRSKMKKSKEVKNKSQTFISHLHASSYKKDRLDYNQDGSKLKPSQLRQRQKEDGKKNSKTDDKQS